jgi:hypothetical protein
MGGAKLAGTVSRFAHLQISEGGVASEALITGFQYFGPTPLAAPNIEQTSIAKRAF